MYSNADRRLMVRLIEDDKSTNPDKSEVTQSIALIRVINFVSSLHLLIKYSASFTIFINIVYEQFISERNQER